MSLDQLLQVSLPAKLEESKLACPTLIIGIGGSGKEIALRLRRRIVERYGSLSMLPFLQFMHVDTDTTVTAQEQYDLRGSDDPLHQEVRFKPVERVDLTIEGGTAKYIEHIDNYPQIKRWFPTTGKTAGLGNLGEGAGQIRMASRLGFFHADNFRRIAQRLEQAKAQLSDAAILQRSARLGFEFEPKGMNVFVLASLAGGTGSGTFLDMGFLLQRYFPSAERVGILLLPAFFNDYAGAERVRANGYAALMELNHYAFGHSFLGDWEGRGEYLPPPPFTTTYLIDGTNEAGLVIGSAGKEYDAYRMVAEVLFHDYSIGKFAGMKRATRVNLINFNLNVYTHNFLNEALRKGSREGHKQIAGDNYPSRFGSFGLATIAFPTDRVRGACASRMAARILDFWQQSVLEDPLEPLFTRLLALESVRFAQGRYERRDGGGILERADIENALLVYEEGGGKTFPSFLWQKAKALRLELEAAPNGQKAVILAERRRELDVLFAREDSDIPGEWGVGVRQIESNLRLYLKQVKDGIEKQASAFANDPRLGVAYSLSLLRELKSLLRNENFQYLPYFTEQVPMWRGAVEHHGSLLDQVAMDIGHHEGHLLFRTADLARDYEKLVGEESPDEPGAFFSHYIARVRKQVARRGVRACEEIDRFLGVDDPSGDGLLGRYYGLLVGFEKLKERLRAKERYFSAPERSELILSLYREGDVEEWYRTWVGEPTEEGETATLKVVASQILTEIFAVDSVTAALSHIQQTAADEVEARVLEHCRKYIASQAKQPDALALLLSDASRLERKQREEMVRQAYRLGKIWLARGERGLEHTGLPPVRSEQRPCLIGLDTGNVARFEDFKKLIEDIRSPGDTPATFLNIGEQNRGMIVFYNELAGVPAFYPGSVTAPRGLRAAYDSYPEKEDLHTDKNRFQFSDLIPKRTEEARQYADSLRAFVLARLLGLLRVRQIADDGERQVFHYSYQRHDGLTVEEVRLGDEMHAVDYLYRDVRAEHLTDRRILLQLADQAIGMLRRQHLLWVYALLLEFYIKMVYPPQDLTDPNIANLTITQYSPEYAVLDVARSQLPQVLGDASEQEIMRKQIQTMRGRPLTEELTYDQFRAALASYTKPAGRFAQRSTTAVGYERVEWRDVFALDPAKVDKSLESEQVKIVSGPVAAGRAAVGGAAGADNAVPERSVGERPCPNCTKPIDRRAIFCVHCKKMIAHHVPCPHCLEPRVPDDLQNCWKCGLKMRDEEMVDCPNCYSWRGYPSQYPCPYCGFDIREAAGAQVPEATAEAPPASPFPPSASPSLSPSPSAPEPDSSASSGSSEPPQPPPAPAASSRIAPFPEPAPFPEQPPPLPVATPAKVLCPTCSSMVPPGPRCPICDGLLDVMEPPTYAVAADR